MSRRRWLVALVAALGVVVWSGLVLAALWNGWLRSPLAPPGDADAFLRAARERVLRSDARVCQIALLRDGRIHARERIARGFEVGEDARFQMASLSKWVTAWGVLRLVESGRLDLDAPVDRALRRWRVPPSRWDASGVTARRLLAHTAGFGDGLGFQGFPPGAALPRIEDELRAASDAMPGADGRTRLVRPPGSKWQYSGGGYLVLQLLIEEVSGERFESFLQREVLDPLGMRGATFDADSVPPGTLVPAWDRSGSVTEPRRFTALAAASLYATLDDMARFALAHAPGADGETPGRGVLRPETLRDMERPVATLLGQPLWGLGVRLHATTDAGGRVIGHDGQNFPGLHHAVRIDPLRGDGLVVLGSGDAALASRLAEEWTFWHTGRGDLDTLRFRLPAVAAVLGAGSVGIAVVAWRVARRRT